MTDPDHDRQRFSGQGLPLTVAVLGLIGVVWIFSLMAPIQQRLLNACAPPVICDPADASDGVIDWELAFTEERAEELLTNWRAGLGTDLETELRRSIALDWWLIVAYFAMLMGLWWLARPLFKRNDRLRAWVVVASLLVFAVVMDLAENLFLLFQIGDPPWHGSAAFAGVFAALKFLSLIATVIALIVVGTVLVCARLSRQRIYHGDQLEKVLEDIRPCLPDDAPLSAVLAAVRQLSPRCIPLEKVLEEVQSNKSDDLPIKDVLEELRQHPSRVVQIETVIAKEREYIWRRREKAELPQSLQNEKQPIGLAFSGGGIRSATINLGVLQTLARRRVLPKIDYLSTVSGGGYIGSALSSLLSISETKYAQSPQGKGGQYEFEDTDKPQFSTGRDDFPFAAENKGAGETRGFGDVQLRHLRAAGEYLVPRRQLFSVELLRTVGSLVGGFLYHLLHIGLLLTSLAAGYLWVIYLMIGDRALRPEAQSGGQGTIGNCETGLQAGCGSDVIALLEKYSEYVREALGLNYAGDWWTHPFLIAAGVGLVVTLLMLLIIRPLLSTLSDRYFSCHGTTIEQRQNRDSVVALVVVLLLAAIGVTWVFALEQRDALFNISIPLAVYAGAGLMLFMRHGWLAAGSGFDRADRSRLAAREGAFIYLAAISVVLVLVVLPFLVFFEDLRAYDTAQSLRNVTGWVLTVLGARLVAGGAGQGAKAATGAGFMAQVQSKVPSVRKVLLGVFLGAALLGGVLLICVWLWQTGPEDKQKQGLFRISVSLGALALVLIMNPGVWQAVGGWLGRLSREAVPNWLRRLNARVWPSWLNLNQISLHYFYRDRLVEAYLRTLQPDAAGCRRIKRDNELMKLTDLHGRVSGQPEAGATSAPYHLLVTCLNLTAGQAPEQHSRMCDQFLFSKLFCGSKTTGFQKTSRYRDGETLLARAMTISGGAASPVMGAKTFFAQSAAMTLLNVRLGQWMENPGFDGGTETRRQEGGIFWSGYLLKELFASTDANHRLVYLSDGGHSGDNLGIRPLLARRCRLIIAVDAEHDPELTFNSLVEGLRQSEVDDGVNVEIDLSPLQPGAEENPSRHSVVGNIHYPATASQPPASGVLVILKSSLTGDEPAQIKNYKRNNGAFPHQTTGDQFFDEAQFEAYRLLGQHIAESLFDERLPEAAEYDSWSAGLLA